MTNHTPDREPDLDNIIEIRDIRPLRRGRRLLTVNGPRRRLRDLSDSEIERWAGEIVDGMAEAIGRERSCTPRA